VTTETKIRVVIVDDSAFMRHALRRMLERGPEIEIVGAARDGEEGVAFVEQFAPDVVTMDVEMRGIGGLEALRRIVARGEKSPPVIMVSALTTEGAQTTLDALHIGAVDFIAKPPPGSGVLDIAALGDDLLEKVREFGSQRGRRQAKPPATRTRRAPDAPSECIAIGTSTGGPVALSRIVPRLPKNFPVPIVIAQHMPPGFTTALAERLDASSEIDVVEGTNGMTLRAGAAVVAPAGQRAHVRRAGKTFALELEEAERGTLTPSVDALFASLGESCTRGALAVLLTGMGRDGVEGLRVVRASGGYAVGQDEASCVVYGMPRAAAEAGLIDHVCALDELPGLLCSLSGLEVPLQRGEGSRPPLPGT
jgi:two-component system, chemotaxis family, protein-glutamate methylesterase/glutaminase